MKPSFGRPPRAGFSTSPGTVYVQLSGNLFKLQAPAVGKVMLA